MATESADGNERVVTISPQLDEWLDERAAELGVDGDELLVQLLSAYRTTAEDTDGASVSLDDVVLEERISTTVDDRVNQRLDSAFEQIDRRVSELEARIDERVDDVRRRVVQLRDAVGSRAPNDHTHAEFTQLDSIGEQLDELDADLEQLRSDVDKQTRETGNIESRLDDIDGKLDRLARAVVSLRRDGRNVDTSDEGSLSKLKRAANRNGITSARCAACGGTVHIGLLSEPACPHCESALRELEHVGSFLRKTTVTAAAPPALESGSDE